MVLTERQKELCDRHARIRFFGLSALFLNCTRKPSGRLSHTEQLLDVSKAIMEANGVAMELLRPVDYDLPPGVYPDMREHGFAHNDWPDISRKVMAANILVVGTPIWLGEESSVCRRVIERLYGESAKPNDRGQYSNNPPAKPGAFGL